MAIDTKSLTQLITEFRKIQAKDAITPETVGYLLQRIADLLATAGTSDTVAKIQQLLDGFKAAGYAITSIAQGQTDRNHVYANIGKVSLSDGKTSSTSGIFIQQATTERAGAMRAQQVTDLNAARTNVAALQKQTATIEEILATMQKALGIGDGSSITNVINTAQISCQVVNGTLRILGAQKLIAAGYVPYLFRLTRKRNQYHHKADYRTEGDANKRYCPATKGWHLYGSCHAVKIEGNTLKFSTNHRGYLHMECENYSSSPSTLVSHHTDKEGCKSFGWGRSVVYLNDMRVANKKKKMRMIRLRFAVGFAKKILPGKSQITPANLVSSMAEFSLIFDPNTQVWNFGK
ncbi:MAG: hypothetical protein NC339_03180 [Muribaculaceae bacterium]|nr:hypothetical protein [Muribaculaceae bacterium]